MCRHGWDRKAHDSEPCPYCREVGQLELAEGPMFVWGFHTSWPIGGSVMASRFDSSYSLIPSTLPGSHSRRIAYDKWDAS